jgi:hypothetical protein
MVVNAVEMVRKIRDRHYEETRNLPFEKQIEYIKKKSQELQKEIKFAHQKVSR